MCAFDVAAICFVTPIVPSSSFERVNYGPTTQTEIDGKNWSDVGHALDGMHLLLAIWTASDLQGALVTKLSGVEESWICC